jgi:succinoglycan biosynthesis transport protein ExoP
MFKSDNDNQSEATLLHYWRILKKRQLTVGLFCGILMGTVAVGTLLSTPFFGSTATLEISPNAPSVLGQDNMSEVVSLSAHDERRAYYATQYRIMESRTIIEETVNRLQERHGITDFDEVESPYEHYKSHLKIKPDFDSRLVHVIIEYPDYDKAALFANTLAETYIEMNLQRSLDTANTAFSWLREQQEIYRQRKYESDQQVHEFKYENRLGEMESVRGTLTELRERLGATHAERVALEATHERGRELARAERWTGLATHMSEDSPVLQSLLQTFRTAEQERDALAVRYLPDHPKMKGAQAKIDGLTTQIRAQVQQLMTGKETEIKIVAQREAALETAALQAQVSLEELEKKGIELAFLQANADKNAGLFSSLDTRMSEVDLASLVQSNNIWFIDRAVASAEKVRPKLTTNLPMAFLIGLLGGVALAFFMEYVDSTIKSREDLEEVVGVPFLGAVPVLTTSDLLSLENERDRNIYVNARPRSTAAEALRSIRTNVLFRTPDSGRGMTRLLIASAVPREGKSFISSNLSSIIAMTGSKVLLIDADLRRPTQHKLFALTNERGLSNVLEQNASIASCVQKTHVDGLDIMPSGPRPANPAELLGSERMTRLLDQLNTAYDFVIIDSSPIGAVADPLILSRFVDGVLMVIESNKTNRDHVLQCRSRLSEVKANILGAIVNKLDIRRTGYGYYYYYDYNSTYGDPPEERQTG